MRRTVLLLTACALLAGCGQDPTTDRTAASKPAAHKAPPTYRQQVAACVHESLYKTRKVGNALRVETPGGTLIANVQTFPSKRAARRFGAQLEVDGQWGGKGVAVWLTDDDADRAVVGDCLTP